MLNEDFLTDVLGNDEVSVEDKIKQIISEHDADTRGLLAKRDELLGSEKKLKEQISAYEEGKKETATKIAELEGLLEKANNGDQKAKEYYETKLADAQKKYDTDMAKITAEKDKYEKLHLTSLRDKAIEEGTKDLNFVAGLKQGFIARVLATNEFLPDTDPMTGQLVFLNKEHHTIEEAINAFALTQEGKAYLANPSSGGGASGSRPTGGGTKEKTMSREQFNDLQKRDPKQAQEFFRNGGRIQ